MAKILIVENEFTSRDLMARMLRHIGHEVEMAESLAAAKAVCSRFTPHVAIIDWMYDDEFIGRDVAAMVRQICPDVRIIIASALQPWTVKDQIADTPVSSWLVKPIEFAVLRRTLDRLAEDQCA